LPSFGFPPSPPLWEGTAGGSRRGGRSAGRRSSAATLERGAALPEDHGEEAEVAMESLSPWRARASAGRRGPHRRRVCGVVQLHPGRATRQEQLRAWLWLLAGVGVAVPVRLLPEAGVVATAWHAARLLALLFDWRGEGKKIGGAGASFLRFLRWWEKQEHKGERARACWIAHGEKGKQWRELPPACSVTRSRKKKSEERSLPTERE